MNILDSVINYFSPTAGLKRAQARAATSVVERNYDITRKGRSNNWLHRTTSATDEVSKASVSAASAAQELCRNNPHAQHTKLTWASSMVAKGIRCEISGNNQRLVERAQKDFDKWAKSTACDFEGHYNFYGLQWLWAATIVESGGVFVRKHVNNAMAVPLQYQTIEQQYLDVSKNESGKIRDGIEYNELGQVVAYHILNDRDELNEFKTVENQSTRFVKDVDIVHLYRKERAGQHLGMTWLAQSGSLLEKLDVLTDARVTQEQVAACLTAFVQNGAGSGMGVNGDADGTEEQPFELEPGIIHYLKGGQEVKFTSPPNASSNGKFNQEVKQDLAVGTGLPYAKFTGDYSQFNFASGRMAKLDFNELLDHVQENVLLPKFDIMFGWFTNLMEIKGYGSKARALMCEWVIPPRAAVDPASELDQIKAEVRAGMKAPSTAVKQWTGKRLEQVMKQWEIDKAMFGDLPFDIDPSKFSLAGNQIDENDAAASGSMKQSEKKDEESSD